MSTTGIVASRRIWDGIHNGNGQWTTRNGASGSARRLPRLRPTWCRACTCSSGGPNGAGGKCMRAAVTASTSSERQQSQLFVISSARAGDGTSSRLSKSYSGSSAKDVYELVGRKSNKPDAQSPTIAPTNRARKSSGRTYAANGAGSGQRIEKKFLQRVPDAKAGWLTEGFPKGTRNVHIDCPNCGLQKPFVSEGKRAADSLNRWACGNPRAGSNARRDLAPFFENKAGIRLL